MSFPAFLYQLGLSALLVIFSAVFALAQTEKPQQPAERRAVPNLVLTTLEGDEWSLEKHRGSIVLLNFWATWCQPCRVEKPMLVKLSDEYERSGLKVAGVALNEDGPELIKKFVAEYKIDYPTLIPPADSPLRSIENLPNTLLIDREGRLVKKYVGAVPESVLRDDIEKLVREPAKSSAPAR